MHGVDAILGFWGWFAATFFVVGALMCIAGLVLDARETWQERRHRPGAP